MVDVVSKNGTFLLSIPLKPDGTIDKQEEEIIADITAWMNINGEAIFETRPFAYYGEGPFAEREEKENIHELVCTHEDFRFTRKGDTLYAICLKAQGDGQLTLHSLGNIKEQVREVSVLGSPSPAKWEWKESKLTIQYQPPQVPVPLHTVKILLKRE